MIYSLVSEKLRSYLARKIKRHHVYAIDLFGPLFKQIGKQLNVIPVSRPGLLKDLTVANIPIIPNEKPPEKIFGVKTRKFGFTISPQKAAIIRKKRFAYAGQSDYIDIESIKREILYSHKIFRKIRGLQVIDVTHCSIEEISEQVLSIVK